MITLLTVLFLVITIVSIIGCTVKDSDVFGGVAAISALVTVGCAVAMIIGICIVSTSSKYEASIAMYEEENTALEEKIDVIVEKYLEHENQVYDKTIPAETLIVIYPELASNTIVTQSIEILQQNREQIKSLKQAQIDLTTWRFLVYFGN